MTTCEVCGRPQEWRQNDDEWCDRHKWNDIHSKEECYRLGYERERAARIVAEQDLHARQCSIVATLGGIVEGAPTGKHNYLQRARALVAAEQRAKKAIAALESLLVWAKWAKKRRGAPSMDEPNTGAVDAAESALAALKEKP